MVKTYRNREFDSGCIPMNYGARVAIRRLSVLLLVLIIVLCSCDIMPCSKSVCILMLQQCICYNSRHIS